MESENLFDAAARGAGTGLTMALNVGAMLIVFIGLIHLVDMLTLRVCGLHVNVMLGWLFRPFAVLMGVPWQDVRAWANCWPPRPCSTSLSPTRICSP